MNRSMSDHDECMHDECSAGKTKPYTERSASTPFLWRVPLKNFPRRALLRILVLCCGDARRSASSTTATTTRQDASCMHDANQKNVGLISFFPPRFVSSASFFLLVKFFLLLLFFFKIFFCS